MIDTTKAAAKTAIHRSKPSVPMRRAVSGGWIQPGLDRVLDYGCGHGLDVAWLVAKGVDATGFDPNHNPNHGAVGEDATGRYDVITCNYVLNTVDYGTRLEILNEIARLAGPSCVVLITVRRDIKQDGWTRKGTYQETVNVADECERADLLPGIRSVVSTSSYETYVWLSS